MADFMGQYFQDTAKAVHENARAKGFWDKPREMAEMLELVHTEIAEATEEIRDKKPLIYQLRPGVKPTFDVVKYGNDRWHPAHKPEGALIEYADAGIRILDMLYSVKADIVRGWDYALAAVVVEHYPNELCFHMQLRKRIDRALLGTALLPDPLIETLALFVKYFRLMRFVCDFRTVIDLKMEYNRTRPYRHGGKLY